MPKAGMRELYACCVSKFGPKMVIGRDRCYDIFRSNGLCQRTSRKRPKTTNSNHNYYIYPDLLNNALAERMNNTIKNGWLFDCDDESFEQVSKRIEDAVYVYNHVRPHQGINMRTPMEVVSETGGLTA